MKSVQNFSSLGNSFDINWNDYNHPGVYIMAKKRDLTSEDFNLEFSY